MACVTLSELKGRLLPYTKGDIPVFQTTSSRDETYDQADTDIRMEAQRRTALDIETFTLSKSFCIPTSSHYSTTRTGFSATSTPNVTTSSS